MEDEIEKMSLWEDREYPPHPEWPSTKSVQATGEMFGIIDAVSNIDIADDDSSRDDPALVAAADDAADEMLELDDGSGDEEEDLMMDHMCASAQWLAGLYHWDNESCCEGMDDGQWPVCSESTSR